MFLPIFVLLLASSCLFCGSARADERVVGTGYAFDLPDIFEETKGPWAVVARATGETLVQGLSLPSEGPPQMRFYAVAGTGAAPEAILLVCRFELRREDALNSIEDLAPGAVRKAYEHAVEMLPGGRLLSTESKALATGLRGAISRFTYPHPSAGNRTVDSVLAVRERTGLILLLDAPVGLGVEYQAYFTVIADSLKLMSPAPSLMAQLRYPIYGLLGILVILLFVSIRLRHRHARKAVRLAAEAPPRQRTRVIACDPNPNLPLADPASAEEPQAASAAAPGGERLPSGTPHPPPAEVATAGGSAKPTATLRAAPPGTGPGPERATPAEAAAVEAVEPEEEGDAPEAPKRPKLKISRNSDFLQG